MSKLFVVVCEVVRALPNLAAMSQPKNSLLNGISGIDLDSGRWFMPQLVVGFEMLAACLLFSH